MPRKRRPEWAFRTRIRKKIQREVESTLNIVVKVKLVEPRSIERSMGKAVRVIDNRELY